ncbi:cytochrome P450 4d2-like [Diabrotica virgifera virgifera]|uniref:Cytochrome P450 4d2-like n=1 Tax=Diabrotica virgifera virgifera TaxID=50390 RepID=A0ABM5KWB2_DIAVI|nr:cytochrome P450 4d2-like [Diabrotica virgifera virgifera]
MLILSVIVAVFVVIVVTLVVTWLRALRKYDSLKNVPGPTPIPIIGNALLMGTTTVALLQTFLDLQKKYGNFYKLWMGPRLHLVIYKPEYLEKIMTSHVHLDKTSGYDLFEPWLGDGLLISTGKKWKLRRKMITPTFHFKILEEFVKVFNKSFTVMTEIMEKKVKQNSNESIELSEHINLASLDAICETAFGTCLNVQRNGNREYVQALGRFLEIFVVRFFSAWLRNPVLFRLSKYYKEYSETLKILHTFTDNIIKARKEEYKTHKLDQEQNSDDSGIKNRVGLLDMLLQAKENGEDIPDEDIRAEVDTFMFEGHDTTSSGIAYTLYALAENPDVQKKLYNEIVDTLGSDKNMDLTISNLNDLKYLDIVVKEAFRKYPPVPMIERKIVEDMDLDATTVPKGTDVSIFLYGMNHDPKVFPNPDKFEPERFLPESISSRHTFAYLPFSAGPRNCIGQKFAVYEVKLSVIKFLLKFELIQDPNFIPQHGLTSVLKSKNGLKVKPRLRD